MNDEREIGKIGRWVTGAALVLFGWVGCSMYGQVAEALRPKPYVAPVVSQAPASVVDPGPRKVFVEGSGYTNPNVAPIEPTAYSTNNSDGQSGYYGSGYAGSYSGSPQRSEDGAPRTVHVSGYRRKDGTYVQPHTRRAPRR